MKNKRLFFVPLISILPLVLEGCSAADVSVAKPHNQNGNQNDIHSLELEFDSAYDDRTLKNDLTSMFVDHKNMSYDDFLEENWYVNKANSKDYFALISNDKIKYEKVVCIDLDNGVRKWLGRLSTSSGDYLIKGKYFDKYNKIEIVKIVKV